MGTPSDDIPTGHALDDVTSLQQTMLDYDASLRKLNRRIRKLEQLRMFVITAAGILGVSTFALFQRLSNANEEAGKLRDQVNATRDTLEDVNRRVAGLQASLGNAPVVIRSMLDSAVSSGKQAIDKYVSANRTTTLSNLTESFFGAPVKLSLDQWHTASSNGFIRVTTGGTGDVRGEAWVGSNQSTSTPNRVSIGPYTSTLLLVRKGEHYRARKAVGSPNGNAHLFWIPIDPR